MSGLPKEAWAELQRDGAACSRSLKRQMVGRTVGSWGGGFRLLAYRSLLCPLLAGEGLLNRALPLLRLEKIMKVLWALGRGCRID